MQVKTAGLVMLLLAVSYAPQSGQTKWKHYRNARWGFCLSYPAGWQTDEGFDKAGIAMYPPQNRPAGSESSISVGALPNNRLARGRFNTLDESFSDELDVLREQGAAEIDVIEKKQVAVKGLVGLQTRIRYREPDTGVLWVEERIAIRTPDEVIHGFELKCHPEEVAALEPVFNSIVFDRFTFECHHESAHPRRCGDGFSQCWAGDPVALKRSGGY